MVKVFRNKQSIQYDYAVRAHIEGETLLLALFIKSANIDDKVEQVSNDISGFAYINLEPLVNENRVTHTTDLPLSLLNLFSHETLGFSKPGYYALTNVFKFTIGGKANRSKFDTRGPQMYTFEIDNGMITRAYNMFPYTAISRDVNSTYYHKERKISALSMLVPYEGAKMKDAALLFNCDVVCNLPVEPMEGFLASLIPVPKLQGPTSVAPDGKVDLQLVFDGDPDVAGDVVLETTAGYINKQRLVVDQDETVSVRATDLIRGDKIRIKAGWKTFPAMSEHTIEVV